MAEEAKGEVVQKVEMKVEGIGGIVTGSDSLVEGGVPRQKRKVAIVGFAPSSLGDVRVLFGDPDFEIWPLNQLYLGMPGIGQHASRWFQLHNRSSYDQAIRDHKHSEWLGSVREFPIYMQRKEPDIPMSVRYPIEEITKLFGWYFTNSISWMIALALYEHIKFGGLEALHIYGVDMAQDDPVSGEYSQQRPSCEWLIGWAMGILGREKVYIPAKSDLMKAMWLYPFEDDSPFVNKINGRIQELGQRAEQMGQQEQGLHDQRMQLLGARDNMGYIARQWKSNSKEQDPELMKALLNREEAPIR